MVDPPTLKETEDAIKKLNNNKASEIDNIPSELLKNGPALLAEKLHNLITKIWQTKQLPDDWNTVTLTPIYKKGDPLDSKNYRGISLLCTAYKVLANILYSGLKPLVEAQLGDYQCGF